MQVTRTTSRARRLLVQICFSTACILVVDATLGSFFLTLVSKNAANVQLEREYRVSDPKFHHNLRANFKGIGFWPQSGYYDICTDKFGFKSPCSGDRTSAHFDFCFIGDSFVEGIGLPYEDTFVGKIARKSKLTVANLGVASYAPSVYRRKVEWFLRRDILACGHVVVYVDLSDVQDEGTIYMDYDFKTPPKSQYPLFPLIHEARKTFRHIFFSRKKGTDSSEQKSDAWLYRENLGDIVYGRYTAKQIINHQIKELNSLANYLKERGIPLSVGIYPWPANLGRLSEESNLEKIWGDFCKSRCTFFFNNFPNFREKISKENFSNVREKFFIPGDSHHNSQGAEIIADNFLSVLKRDGKYKKN